MPYHLATPAFLRQMYGYLFVYTLYMGVFDTHTTIQSYEGLYLFVKLL